MKTRKIFGWFILGAFLFASCGEDSNDNTSGDVKDANVAYLQQVDLVMTDGDYSEQMSATLDYNVDTKLEKVTYKDSDGDLMSGEINYGAEGRLSSIDMDGNTFQLGEFFGIEYDLFKEGVTIEYDENKNPSKIVLEEEDEEWNEETKEWEDVTYKMFATIEYDEKPFFLYHTLKASGIIDMMESINLLMTAVPSDMITLNSLLPLNNITNITIEDEKGYLIASADIDYVYNAKDYPESAKVTYTEGGDRYNVSPRFNVLKRMSSNYSMEFNLNFKYLEEK